MPEYMRRHATTPAGIGSPPVSGRGRPAAYRADRPCAITRREFVKVGALLVAGAAVTGASGCAAGLEEGSRAAADTPSHTYAGREGGDMSGRILVGYATRTGSTVGVAEAIGETLASRGFDVDVEPMREKPSLQGYDAVVLGSAVNGAAWLPEAMGYVESNADALSKMPVAAFCVHIMNGGTDGKATRKRLAYLDQVRTVFTPVDEGYFLGKGPEAEDTSLIARWAFRAFGGSGEGDCRDWDKIRDWAAQARV